MKPRNKVLCEWSPEFSYAIGLIATDGNLSSDGRHICFTSKDYKLATLFHTFLQLNTSIGKKARAGEVEKKYYVVQFGDVSFYRFLLDIGLTPKKSKTIGEIKIPKGLFYDFLRGCIDGDGSIGHFVHPESKQPQLRVRLVSASKGFLLWIQRRILSDHISGYIYKTKSVFTLAYPMGASKKLLSLIYYSGCPVSLERKLVRAKPYLRV